MRYQEIFEAPITSDDLFRKIEALDAMIDDPSTTAGEKENAKSLKIKIQARLETEFPGSKPPTRSQNQQYYSNTRSYEQSFWDDIAREIEERQKREELWAKNPGLRMEWFREKLEKLKTQRKNLQKWAVPGDVETRERIKNLDYEIERILKKEFPAEWKEILNKRDERNLKRAETTHKKKQEKIKTQKDQIKQAEEQGFLTLAKLGEAYNVILERIHNGMVGLKFNVKGFPPMTVKNFKNGRSTLSDMKYWPTGELRKVWNNLNTQDQQLAIEMINKVHIGSNYDTSYTEAQKKRILDSFRQYVKK